MTRQKAVAVAFLSGALLVGGLLGFTADRLVLRADAPKQWDPRQLRTRLAEDLALDVTQRAAVDSILDRRSARERELIAPIQLQLDSAVERARDEIRAVLRADQREQFEVMVRESEKSEARRRAARDSADRAKERGPAGQ